MRVDQSGEEKVSTLPGSPHSGAVGEEHLRDLGPRQGHSRGSDRAGGHCSPPGPASLTTTRGRGAGGAASSP